jgi:gamma-glutamylcyclotransferase (GGCT)/AIG2-like uncharacterized protein YtfP
MPSHIFAFYGSLRRGMENHDTHKGNSEYLFSARLKGYKLYSKGQYPCAVKSADNDGAITVEVFEISNKKVIDEIHQLELDEGYYCDEELINGMAARIYLYKSPENYQEVVGGDWVTFFRQRSDSA